MSSARAIAAKERRYAGVRFQEDYNGDQYMIFIIYDASISNGWQGNLGFRAVEGSPPVKLPAGIKLCKNEIAPGMDTTISVVFSPSGKLVIHNLWVRNRDNVSDDSSLDDIFNTPGNVDKVGCTTRTK